MTSEVMKIIHLSSLPSRPIILSARAERRANPHSETQYSNISKFKDKVN